MSAALILDLVRPDLTDVAAKFEFTHDYIKDLAGGEHLSFNNSVFLSEGSAADRNHALAYFMRENKCFPPGVDIRRALDFHFQVSVVVLSVVVDVLSVVADVFFAVGGVAVLSVAVGSVAVVS